MSTLEETNFTKLSMEIPQTPSICLRPISNQGLLIATTVLFTLFVTAEFIGGYAANSLALLGDAAAMSIDVFTYGSNLYAECLKDSELSFSKKVLSQIVIPIFSLSCLLAVTVWVAFDAYLRLGNHKYVRVELNLMYIFAGVNFGVDLCCGLLFWARRNNVFNETISRKISVIQDSNETDWSNHSDADEGINMTQINHSENLQLVRGTASDESVSGHTGVEERPNLNMLSAFTHIGGDTLRTLAIFGAASVSSLFGIDPQISDAWAGIAVSITIVIAVSPLVLSIKKSIQTVMGIAS